MKSHDWRFLSGREAAALHDAEAGRWLSQLHWDTSASVARIESARRVGALPGLAVRDAQGAIRGWTFYLVHQGVLQVGAFVADAPDVTALLLDAIGGAAAAAAASAVMLFVFPTPSPLAEQLAARGFLVERYRYLQVELDDGRNNIAPSEPGLCTPDGWDPARRDALASLLRRAYASDTFPRPFARNGSPREWLEYVTQLLTTSACGVFLPEASAIAPADSSAALDGAALITRLAPDTAHLAQIAVDPDAQGRGLARDLLTASLAAARAAGCRRATLLVSEHNAAAGRLYQAMGFSEVAAFVSASRDEPRRSSVVAPAASTPL